MRARLIKPGFWTNEVLAELPYEGRLLFIGLWNLADREGRLEDRPLRIKGEIFRYDPLSGEDVDRLLAMLAERGFITRYEVDGRRYIQIATFTKHQHVHPREAQSAIPAPDQSGASTGPDREFPGSSVASPEIPCTATDEQRTSPSEADREAEAEGDSPPYPPSGARCRFGAKPASPDGADAPSPSTPPADAEHPAEHPFALLQALCDEIGADVSTLPERDKARQLAVAKRLVADGMTAAEVRRETRWLLSQPWITGGVDLHLVEKQRGKWVLAGRPDAARMPRASPNGRARASPRDSPAARTAANFERAAAKLLNLRRPDDDVIEVEATVR